MEYMCGEVLQLICPVYITLLVTEYVLSKMYNLLANVLRSFITSIGDGHMKYFRDTAPTVFGFDFSLFRVQYFLLNRVTQIKGLVS